MYAAVGVWPKARANCVTKFGLCSFFDHCAENQKLVPIRKREWVAQDKNPIAAATKSQMGLANDSSLEQMSPAAATDENVTTTESESEGSNA
jgi:hypothetical protein